jgi:hypothetical protein
MPQIPVFPIPDTGAYALQQGAEFEAQIESRGGTESANPPSTNLPPSVRLESDQPPPIPSTGVVPFFNPVNTPRVDESLRTVNNLPPTMSVNLREDFINEAEGGHTPLTPNIISRDGKQVMTDGRPGGPEDKVLPGPNAVGTGPIINPIQPVVTPPVVAPPAPLDDLD